ncbi:MAG: CRISPR-associated endonuclease Cas2 [Planctomycetes bacterium]|nr:CRISPR-associated endonuclease Cas2 [Planctomycetota bacterium]MCC7065160.1 CRISPR-associated endonuclease Cas2 [Planctomycetota bacterium]
MTRLTQRHHYFVSYDISDDHRRNQVFQVCKDFGNHVQYSVFLCELDRRELVLLREQLRELIHHGEDQVLLVDVGPAVADVLSSMDVLGQPYAPPGRHFVV